ncbi:MAG: glycoside hydrolase family 127 protein [Vicinamibacteria bacterium]
MLFNDTDAYKLIEGASYSLQTNPDPELERYLDGIIAFVASAQEKDGYLTTYKTDRPRPQPGGLAKPGPKSGDLELQGSHELYNSGHLFESAYAHFRATGKRSLLDIALRNAVSSTARSAPGKRLTPPGHQIVETGLFKLAEVTRGTTGSSRGSSSTSAAMRPATQSSTATTTRTRLPRRSRTRPSATRFARPTCTRRWSTSRALEDDPLYREATERIWTDVVGTKLYLTGGLGSRHEQAGELLSLPNRTAYAETCASIASVYRNQRLFSQSGDAKYVDVLERTLYNAAIAGVSLSGDLFYPNPLESDAVQVQPGSADLQPWFDCSCCPTNLARFLPSPPDYVYATRGASVYVNLFVASEASFDLDGGRVIFAQATGYPWTAALFASRPTGRARSRSTSASRAGPATSRCRARFYRYVASSPGAPKLAVNGEPVPIAPAKGYAVLARTWKPGDVVASTFRWNRARWSPTTESRTTVARWLSSAGRSSTAPRSGQRRERPRARLADDAAVQAKRRTF